jgi:hypothetical protein
VITKGFYISLLVAAAILGTGAVLFRDSDAGVQASTAIALVVGAVLLRVFDTREGRGGRSHN